MTGVQTCALPICDCRPPCVLNCPAHTDCQGYVGFLAEGDFKKGIELVTEKIPLPAFLGRVCPHPCEENCRRALVDEPIAIRDSKRLLAEEAFFTEDFAFKLPEEFTGKKVSIIGGGPINYFLEKNIKNKQIFNEKINKKNKKLEKIIYWTDSYYKIFITLTQEQ